MLVLWFKIHHDDDDDNNNNNNNNNNIKFNNFNKNFTINYLQ